MWEAALQRECLRTMGVAATKCANVDKLVPAHVLTCYLSLCDCMQHSKRHRKTQREYCNAPPIFNLYCSALSANFTRGNRIYWPSPSFASHYAFHLCCSTMSLGKYQWEWSPSYSWSASLFDQSSVPPSHINPHHCLAVEISLSGDCAWHRLPLGTLRLRLSHQETTKEKLGFKKLSEFGNSSLQGYESSQTLVLLCFGAMGEGRCRG